MATLSVRIRYRPIRFGLCVRRGNLDDVRRVLRLTHTLWGGAYNPIIPVDGSDFPRQLVEVFRVDALHPATDDALLKTFTDSFPHLMWPSFYKEFFIDAEPGKVATFLDVYHPVRSMFEEYIKDKPEPKLDARIYDWDLADPLADVLLAYVGAYPAAADIGKDYGDFVARNLGAVRIRLNPGDALPDDVFKALTPAMISGYELTWDRSPNWDNPGIYVGSASDFEDVVNFWNLRASSIDVIFFDPAHEARLRGVVDAYLAVLRMRPEDPLGWGDRVGVWCKGGAAVDSAAFGAKTMTIELGDGIWNGLNIKPPLTYIGQHSALASISDSHGIPSLSFELRAKPFYDEPELHVQSLIVSIRPLVDLGRNEETTFRYPYIPELNEYYGREAHIIYNEARAEREGIGIVASVTSDDLTIHSLRKRELVSRIFLAFGIKAEPSEPGRVATRLIQQMGGIQRCRVFKIAGVRELIDRYGPLKAFTRSNAVQVIGQNDPATGKPRFERYEELFIEPRDRGNLTPHQAFDFLLKQGVFRVGLNFLCPSCELEFWLPLDNVSVELTCEYCGQRFNVSPQLRDRDWAYRRSGLFGREDHQQGSVPVALTLQQIDTVLHTEGILVTGMNLEPVTAAIESCETDFVIVSEEGFEDKVALGIGECKAKGEISEEDVRKLTRVADALSSARRIQPYIIFSKTAPFTLDEVARCRTAQSTRRQRVILLSPRELEPYFVYALSAKEFDIRSTAISLEDMARATHGIYFDPKRKATAVPAAPELGK